MRIVLEKFSLSFSEIQRLRNRINKGYTAAKRKTKRWKPNIKGA